MERHFEQQLNKLKTKIIKMSSLVDDQVDFAIRCIEEENKELAAMVVERDKKVDKYDVKIGKICQKILAINQPVAMDLRLIMTALTINTNLERVGDIAVNIAEGFLSLQKKPDFIGRTKFTEMAAISKEMIRTAIDSFIEGNAKLAQKVIERDNALDDLNRQNYQIVIDIMKESHERIEPAVTLLMIARELERLGDHATNIAEDVFFIVEAELIKHKYEKFLFPDDEEDDEETPPPVNPQS